MGVRFYSSSSEYVNMSGGASYEPTNRVSFTDGRSTIFGSEGSTETRYVPWAIKEHTFKHGMGFMGANVVGYLFPVGSLGSIAGMCFMANWARRCTQILTRCVNKIELHEDGQTVTMHQN